MKAYHSVSASIFITLFLAAGPTVQAGQEPSGFDPQKWARLLELAIASPARQVYEGLESRSLAHVLPNDRTAPRDADYLTLIGRVDSQNQYSPLQVSLVSEQWRRPQEGVWEIEQWIFGAGLGGALHTLDHRLIVEDDGGRVLDNRDLPKGRPEDDAEAARLGAKINSWFDWEEISAR